MDNQKIGQRIADARWNKKMTQGKLAKNVGISPSYMNDIEHGRRLPSLKVAVRIVQAVGESMDTIFLN